MQRFMAGFLLMQMASACSLLFAQTPSRLLPTDAKHSLYLQGRVVAEDGQAISGAIIDAVFYSSREPVVTTITDDQGYYRAAVPRFEGELLVKLSCEHCSTVVRRGITAGTLIEHASLDFRISYCEPGLPPPKHDALAVLSSKHYVGNYETMFLRKDSPAVYGTIELIEGTEPSPSRCPQANLAITCAASGGIGYECWKVMTDGTIKLYSPEQGLLGGYATILWRSEHSLIGYRFDWSDTQCGASVCLLECKPF